MLSRGHGRALRQAPGNYCCKEEMMMAVASHAVSSTAGVDLRIAMTYGTKLVSDCSSYVDGSDGGANSVVVHLSLLSIHSCRPGPIPDRLTLTP
jgi:hypothetical protein